MAEVIANERGQELLRELAHGWYARSLRRLLVIILHGAMGGAVSMGALQAFSRVGITPLDERIIAATVGVSAGTGNCVGWHAHRFVAVLEFYKEIANRIPCEWWRRLVKQDLFSVDELQIWMRDLVGTDIFKGVGVGAYAAVTDESGEGDLIDLRSLADPFPAVQASMQLPYLFRGSVRIGSKGYLDGACGISFAQMIKRTQADDVLIIGSRPIPPQTPVGEMWCSPELLRMVTLPYSRRVQDQIINVDVQLKQQLVQLQNQVDVPVCGIFPTPYEALCWDCSDETLVHQAFWNYYRTVKDILRSV